MVKVRIVPTTPLDPMFAESPTRSTPPATSRVKDKFGNQFLTSSVTTTRVPPDRPNAVLSDEGKINDMIKEIEAQLPPDVLQRHLQKLDE